MDVEFMKYLASLGVGGIIAGIIFMIYRKDMREYQEEWKGQREILVNIVKENSIAITANTETIRALHRRLDAEERGTHPPGRRQERVPGV